MTVERKDRKGSNMGTYVQRNWEPPSACAECTAAESDSESSEETDTDVETADAAVQVNIGGRNLEFGILLRCHLSQYHDISLARENRGSPGRASLANLEELTISSK